MINYRNSNQKSLPGMSLKHNHSVQMTLNQHKCAIARRRKAAIKKHKHQQRIDAKVKQVGVAIGGMGRPKIFENPKFYFLHYFV